MIRETLRLAFRTLRANPFRTLLTVLSVLIGNFSIVVMLSLAQAGHRTLSSTIESVGGARLLLWIPAEGKTFTSRDRAIYDRGLTDEDLARLRQVPHLARIAVQGGYGNESVWATPNAPRSADIAGLDLGLLDILGWSVGHGRAFVQQDLDQKRRVAIVTDPLAAALYGTADAAIGKTLFVQRKPYTIAGVLEPRDMMGLHFGFSWTDSVFVPISTAEDREGRPEQARYFTALTEDPAFNDSVEAMGNARLLSLHRGVEDFQSLDFNGFLEQFYTFFLALDAVVALIAGVSLFAGGIGVMNIMLVSVSERVREIGVRKALGASRVAVMGQFLLEAIALSLGGGVTGVVLGLAAVTLAHVLIALAQPNWVPVWSVAGVVAALGSTAGIGLFFGAVPAWRASRLDIVECLRR